MDVRDACRLRSISTIDVDTPLLVPSFSSRGFSDLAEVHELMRDFLYEASLVSAYDWEHLPPPEVYATEVLFLDSGGYEARPRPDVMEPYRDERPGQSWTLEDYQLVLDEIEPLSRLVVVNFDHAEPAPLPDQIRRAQSLFERYPTFASNFLCKPGSLDVPFVDVDSIVAASTVLTSFDVIGVTDEELGDTLLNRCKNLLRIRGALHRLGCETPIHVFGGLEPMKALAYFLCGADIFDGLAWLRLAFLDGIPIYHTTSIILEAEWEMRDPDAHAARSVANLQWLRTQEKAMRRYSQSHMLEDFGPTGNLVERVLPLVKAAGLAVQS
jgi:hypothetical protein